MCLFNVLSFELGLLACVAVVAFCRFCGVCRSCGFLAFVAFVAFGFSATWGWRQNHLDTAAWIT